MKLALGTVQLGLPYGINNLLGVPHRQEIKSIFQLAADSGIDLLDTAVAYGDSENNIGELSEGRFKIVSKLPAFDDHVEYSAKWLENVVEGSLSRLKENSLYGLLLHKPDYLLGTNGDAFYRDLENLKARGKVRKIGISVYTPEELDKLFSNFHFDIVQFPLNLFDRRFIESGWANKLFNYGVEVHVRSVFLQGLLLTPPSERMAKFGPWSELFARYDTWLADTGLSALEASLRFGMSFDEISKVIVGVENSDQLSQIISASNDKEISAPIEIRSDDPNLINPLSWLNF